MNIYATGMNPADSNALKREPRVRLFQAFVEMMKHLRRQGDHVTWKATKVGDPLPWDTDVVFVSSMLPRSLNCPYALGVIWTIAEALARDIPLVVYLTDWAFFRANGEFKSIAKAGEEYFFKTIGGSPQYREDPAKLREAAPALLDICRQYNDPESKLSKTAQFLVPKYTNWGQVGIIQNLLYTQKPVLTFDPTPIFVKYLDNNPVKYPILPMEFRTKRWILPSLLKDDAWIDKQLLEWPIERFGPRGYQVLASEWDIQRQYTDSVGALCPPYPHTGSGWWRSRWIHSAKGGSILLSSSRDAFAAGFPMYFSGEQIEEMSPIALSRLADTQREAIDRVLQRDFEIMDQQIKSAIWGAGTRE